MSTASSAARAMPPVGPARRHRADIDAGIDAPYRTCGCGRRGSSRRNRGSTDRSRRCRPSAAWRELLGQLADERRFAAARHAGDADDMRAAGPTIDRPPTPRGLPAIASFGARDQPRNRRQTRRLRRGRHEIRRGDIAASRRRRLRSAHAHVAEHGAVVDDAARLEIGAFGRNVGSAGSRRQRTQARAASAALRSTSARNASIAASPAAQDVGDRPPPAAASSSIALRG